MVSRSHAASQPLPSYWPTASMRPRPPGASPRGIYARPLKATGRVTLSRAAQPRPLGGKAPRTHVPRIQGRPGAGVRDTVTARSLTTINASD